MKKFKDLKEGKMYSSDDGYFKFTGMRNESIAEFEQVDSDGNTIDNCIYKTKNDIQKLYEI